MPRAPRVCAQPDCGQLVADRGRCHTHTRTTDLARGTRQTRGYDRRHDTERRRWTPQVATGRVDCWRCTQPITPGTDWDLGHDDTDRNKYAGPEHSSCNRAAAGRARHDSA